MQFFGNLYHLNAEEEPENVDYPKDPSFRQRFGPRGVLRCKATDTDDPTVDPRFGRVGKQVIEDTGPLNRKRMETVDEEFLPAATDFIERNTRDPGALVLLPEHHTHARVHPPEARVGGQDGSGRLPRRAWWNSTATSGRCSTSSMKLALLTTPWWCSPPTTAQRCCPRPDPGAAPVSRCAAAVGPGRRQRPARPARR